MNSGIYKLTSPSGKVYIGQSHNLEQRFKCYKNSPDAGQPRLYGAIKKYGWDNFKKEILVYCNDQWLMDHTEIELIKLYDSTNRVKGYNVRLGGSRGKLSNETKVKISLARTGKPLTEATKLKMSASKLGIKHSQESKDKRSRALKGKPRSSETINKWVETKNKLSPLISKFDLAGNLIQTKQLYEFVREDGKHVYKAVKHGSACKGHTYTKVS